MRKPAITPNDLEKFFVERVNSGDSNGLVALYETNAVIAYDNGQFAMGQNQIREFFIQYLASRPQLDPSNQADALCSENLALTTSQLTNGDITAEIARQQTDGSWLWVVDQFTLGNKAP